LNRKGDEFEEKGELGMAVVNENNKGNNRTLHLAWAGNRGRRGVSKGKEIPDKKRISKKTELEDPYGQKKGRSINLGVRIKKKKLMILGLRTSHQQEGKRIPRKEGEYQKRDWAKGHFLWTSTVLRAKRARLYRTHEEEGNGHGLGKKN